MLRACPMQAPSVSLAPARRGAAGGLPQSRPALRRCGTAPARRAARPTRAAAAGSDVAKAPPDVNAALACLRAAAQTALPAAPAVCAAMKALEAAKLSADGLATALAGAGSRRRWRLVFTSSSSDIRSATGGGRYFPITAVQSWELPMPAPGASTAVALDGQIVNGVYGGYLFALQFSGPCRLTGKRLEFDFTSLAVKVLGGTARFKLKAAGYELPQRGTREAGKLPFFLFAQADENTVVARGRSGGLAVWARAEPSWVLLKGAEPLQQ